MWQDDQVAPGVRARAEEIVVGFDAVARDDDLVQDSILLERAQRKNFIIRVVFDEENGSIGHENFFPGMGASVKRNVAP